MASLGWKPDPSKSNLKWMNACAATILSKNILLTAAHCFKSPRIESKMKIRVGDSNLDDDNDDIFAKIYEMDIKVIHPKYLEGQAYYDVALIYTTEEIEFNEGIQPICLPERAVSENPDNREDC